MEIKLGYFFMGDNRIKIFSDEILRDTDFARMRLIEIFFYCTYIGSDTLTRQDISHAIGARQCCEKIHDALIASGIAKENGEGDLVIDKRMYS